MAGSEVMPWGAIVMRKDPLFDSEFFYAVHLLQGDRRSDRLQCGSMAPGRARVRIEPFLRERVKNAHAPRAQAVSRLFESALRSVA
jgi:hypothetical protein